MSLKLEIRDLSIFSKDSILVHPTTLSIEVGKPLVLLGESGAGKSLIMNAIMGILPQELSTNGEILLNGTNLLAQTSQEKRKLWGKQISMLPQEPWRALDPTMKITHQIEEVYKYIHQDVTISSRQKTMSTLGKMHLQASGNLYPFELSGGMCQRAVIAITDALNSEVVLIDEPTKGLDSDLCSDIINLLQEEVQKNKLLFIITHDIEVAKNIKGTLGIMRNGAIIEYEKSDKLFDNPQHPYTKELLRSQSSYWEINTTLPENDSILEASHISKSYENRKEILSNINFTLHKGEIISIVGSSGSGKSTLGDIALGVKQASKGSIVKKEPTNLLKYQKIYQQPSSAFLPNQTLLEGFQDLMKLHQIKTIEFEQLLKRLKLQESILQRQPHEVSGGELQRVAIARALLLKPIFLFADEPTSQLDSITQQEIIFLLLELVQQEQLSLLFVTHDKILADKISHHIIDLD